MPAPDYTTPISILHIRRHPQGYEVFRVTPSDQFDLILGIISQTLSDYDPLHSPQYEQYLWHQYFFTDRYHDPHAVPRPITAAELWEIAQRTACQTHSARPDGDLLLDNPYLAA